MSMRTLIEINHDYAHKVTEPEVMHFLRLYMKSGHEGVAEQLERFGIRVIAMRHHSDKFRLASNVDGFPAIYSDSDRNPKGEKPAEALSS